MKRIPSNQSGVHWANRLLNRFGWHLSRDKDPRYRFALLRFNESLIDCFPLILGKLLDKNAVETVVQIGANDGQDGDPLTPFLRSANLRALLVEPQPEAAARLRELHVANERVTVAELAITTEKGTLTLWQSEATYCNGYRLDRITSTDRGHVERFLHSRNLPVEVKQLQVAATTVEGVLADNNMLNPDVVIIDAEGHDKAILDQFELSEGAPKLIHVEISNLSGPELSETRERLVRHGYHFALTERDATCVHESVIEHFLPSPDLAPFKEL